MSLHYILDGYNIIHQIPGLSKGNLSDQRDNLINYINNKLPQGSLRNQVKVVFDGKADVFSSNDYKNVGVVFSKGETADHKIKDLVEKSSNKKNIVVVTNDRGIKYAVRPLGAKVIAVKEFLINKQETKASQAKINKGHENIKRVSKAAETKITEELKSVWLKD